VDRIEALTRFGTPKTKQQKFPTKKGGGEKMEAGMVLMAGTGSQQNRCVGGRGAWKKLGGRGKGTLDSGNVVQESGGTGKPGGAAVPTLYGAGETRK